MACSVSSVCTRPGILCQGGSISCQSLRCVLGPASCARAGSAQRVGKSHPPCTHSHFSTSHPTTPSPRHVYLNVVRFGAACRTYSQARHLVPGPSCMFLGVRPASIASPLNLLGSSIPQEVAQSRMVAEERLYRSVYPVSGGCWQAIQKLAGKTKFIGSANSQARVFLVFPRELQFHPNYSDNTQ